MAEAMVEVVMEAVVVAVVHRELPKAILVQEPVQDKLALVLSAVLSWRMGQ
jgi:hypothetical protein